MNNTTEIM